METLLQVAMVKIAILDTLDKAGGQLDALTLFTLVAGMVGDSSDPLAVVEALGLEPTDIIRVTEGGLTRLTQERQSLGGE